MNFIGHNEVRRGFEKSIKSNAPSHAHLIIGPDGIGKSLLAKEWALEILGKTENRDYIDIVQYRTEKASFGVDDIREVITEVNKKPYEGDKKVIIINQGNKLTVQAQNALLKTIEEPPNGVYIIITCESGELILDTIKSRCQIHKLTPLSIEEMNKFIVKEHNDLSPEMKKTVLAFAEGIPGKIDKFLNNETFAEIRNMAVSLLHDSGSKESSTVLKYEEKLSKLNDKKDEFMSMIVSFVRDIILAKELNETPFIINSDKIEDIKKLANEMSFKKLNSIVDIVLETKRNLDRNTNAAITFDVMLIKILEV